LERLRVGACRQRRWRRGCLQPQGRWLGRSQPVGRGCGQRFCRQGLSPSADGCALQRAEPRPAWLRLIRTCQHGDGPQRQ
jgi:hypothetical protein